MMVKSNVLASLILMTMNFRRLNTEAAKAIQYGNLDPNEALKLVTINPAKQLKIDKYVGSLEPKKMLILLFGMVNHYLYIVKLKKHGSMALDIILRRIMLLEERDAELRSNIIQKYYHERPKYL